MSAARSDPSSVGPARPARPATERRAGRRADRAALLLTVAGCAASFAFAARSDGVYHDDDLAHLQIARWALEEPAYLVHGWGRPGFTLLYVLPAQLGWLAARLTAGLLTGATAWLAYGIGRRLGLRAAWIVPGLVWLQPLTFALSYTTLTETVLAFYLTAALRLHLAGRRAWGAAIASLCAVTRYEAAVLLPVWGLALGRGADAWRAWLLLAWAPLAQGVLGYVLLGRESLAGLLHPRPTDYYGAGDWSSMPAAWLLAAGPGIILLAAAGAPSVWRRPGGRLIVGAGALYFATHAVIYAFGLFASAGYARFLVPIGPIAAVAAAEGLGRLAGSDVRSGGRGVRQALAVVAGGCALLWLCAEREQAGWLWSGMTWPVLILSGAGWLAAGRPSAAWSSAGWDGLMRRGVVLLSPAWLLSGALGQALHEARPHALTQDQLLILEATDWLRTSGLAGRRIVSANVWVYEFLGLRRSPFDPTPREALGTLREGELFVWDARYCPQTWVGLPLDLVRQRDELREIWHGGEHARDGVYCRIFERRGARSGATTTRDR